MAFLGSGRWLPCRTGFATGRWSALSVRSARATEDHERLLRVPEITVYFWIVKGLSTALGEATSDYLVRELRPAPAVVLGFACFVGAMTVQLTRRRYVAWSYWLAVVMVGVFGTMAADVLHVGLGVPYLVSTVLFAASLAAIFVAWYRTEKTLSIHSIDRPTREVFYWGAVIATFALGTSVGDLTAITFHLGYATSVLVFVAVIAIPILGFWRFGWPATLAFWFAYVVTRPIGATLADWTVKPAGAGGLEWSEGVVCLALAAAIVVVVGSLSVTRLDVQTPAPGQ